MITKPTVLILGAGASVDYGFPTGRGLVSKICSQCIPGSSVYNFLTGNMERDRGLLEEFAEALEKSLTPSVDRFLEENGQYEEIGKLAIAATLIPYETYDAFKRQGEAAVKSQGEARWYEYLFHLMVEGGHFRDNKLSILTFNYDRSLEACFFQAIKNFYHLNDLEAEAVLKKIPIIHLYGSLGDQLIGDGVHRGYEPRMKGNWIEEAAKRLKILHEDYPLQEFNSALNKLGTADEVIFLGFGFHPINVERLRLRDAVKFHEGLSRKTSQRRFACRFGMGQAEVARAKAYMHGLSVEFSKHHEWDIDTYLKNTECLIPET